MASLVVAASASLLLAQQPAIDHLKRVSINGAELAYVEAGSGDPLVLVHGGLQDYRLWNEHLPLFAKQYRVIAYSRRNHFPNHVSAEGIPDAAGDLHAEDLATLIKALGLTRPHVVGHSSGALTVLFFAATHAGVARTLALNEPNAISLLSEAPDGVVAVKEFNQRFAPARDAFRQGEIARALPLWADAVSGPGAWTRRPDAIRRMNLDNALANVADQRSTRPRTPFTCQMAQHIVTPTLLSTGERSPAFFHRIVDVLEGCLPTRERVSLSGASHTVPLDNAEGYRAAVLAFLAKH
jgi:non-heme chloroperoxidase